LTRVLILVVKSQFYRLAAHIAAIDVYSRMKKCGQNIHEFELTYTEVCAVRLLNSLFRNQRLNRISHIFGIHQFNSREMQPAGFALGYPKP
jgi:hypothetical protein